MKLLNQYGIEIDKSNPPSIVYADTKILKICIHNYAGCGKEWYLSIPDIGIQEKDLKTEDFTEALENAKKIVIKRFAVIREEIEKFTR